MNAPTKLVLAACLLCSRPCHSEQFMGCALAGTELILLPVFLGGLGLTVGAVAGAATVRHQWRPADMPPARVSRTARGQVGLALRTPF